MAQCRQRKKSHRSRPLSWFLKFTAIFFKIYNGIMRQKPHTLPLSVNPEKAYFVASRLGFTSHPHSCQVYLPQSKLFLDLPPRQCVSYRVFCNRISFTLLLPIKGIGSVAGTFRYKLVTRVMNQTCERYGNATLNPITNDNDLNWVKKKKSKVYCSTFSGFFRNTLQAL